MLFHLLVCESAPAGALPVLQVLVIQADVFARMADAGAQQQPCRLTAAHASALAASAPVLQKLRVFGTAVVEPPAKTRLKMALPGLTMSVEADK